MVLSLFLLELLDLNTLLLNHLRLYHNLFLVIFILLPKTMGNIGIGSCRLLVVQCHGLLSLPSNLSFSFHLLNFLFAFLDKKASFLWWVVVLANSLIQKLAGLSNKDVLGLFLMFLLFIILNIFKVNLLKGRSTN